MEVVSRSLGHSKLQTTQEHYGEVIMKRDDMEVSKIKLN